MDRRLTAPPEGARLNPPRPPAGLPIVSGKFFHVGGERFPVRGVTYGTFRQGELGLLPDFDQVKGDFVRMVEAGVNTVRTYTPPDRRILELANELDLKLLVGVWWEDPRYLDIGEAWTAMEARARQAVVEAAEACAGHPAVLGLVVGNEIPGSVVRFHGRRKVERLLRNLYVAGKETAPDILFSYANYPTTQYLDTSFFDFECVNVFLEDERSFRRYLAQLQVEAGNRPVVLTEVGLDAGAHGVRRQAEVLDWQLQAAMEHGMAGTFVFAWTDEWWVGGLPVKEWSFGVTWPDREPKPALGVLAHRYRGGLLGCRDRWPRVTVVVCAYQEEDHIERCLESLVHLHYPDYEVIVVDDGSTDATAAKARRFPVQVLAPGRQGLSGARNTGLQHATGEVVAYIDADAWADQDWLTFLVLGLDPADAAGVGGPNLCPPDSSPVAQCIGRAPGGPVHVLIDNTRAEHIPGCNMAFRRDRLREIGGFDPTYRTAGDDVDLCWRLQDGDYTIRFHPAALVWHLPRTRVRAFWRQQVGYGRAEALVARNHPDKFDGLGRAIWRGVIYGPASILPGRSAVYGGRFGQAPYQRLYQQRSGINVVAALYLIAGLLALTAVDPHLFPLPLVAIGALLGAALATGTRRARRDGLGRLQG
ncbi:MAG: glycosyltransferase, partial [Acidimicrobiia bacterium]